MPDGPGLYVMKNPGLALPFGAALPMNTQAWPMVQEVRENEPCWGIIEEVQPNAKGEMRRLQLIGVIRWDRRVVFPLDLGPAGSFLNQNPVVVLAEKWRSASGDAAAIERKATVESLREEADVLRGAYAETDNFIPADYEPIDFMRGFARLYEQEADAYHRRRKGLK